METPPFARQVNSHTIITPIVPEVDLKMSRIDNGTTAITVHAAIPDNSTFFPASNYTVHYCVIDSKGYRNSGSVNWTEGECETDAPEFTFFAKNTVHYTLLLTWQRLNAFRVERFLMLAPVPDRYDKTCVSMKHENTFHAQKKSFHVFSNSPRYFASPRNEFRGTLIEEEDYEANFPGDSLPFPHRSKASLDAEMNRYRKSDPRGVYLYADDDDDDSMPSLIYDSEDEEITRTVDVLEGTQFAKAKLLSVTRETA